jgi:hypothetical protein
MSAERSGRGRSSLGRVLRTIFWALAFAFVVGLVIGTLLRREVEEPVRYIGARCSADSVLAIRPGNVRDVFARVLVARDHEEQV